MEQKQRVVSLAQTGHFTVTELCVEFGITRKTGHKWLARYAAGGMAGLAEHSRAPHGVTGRTAAAMERLIVSEKELHLTWRGAGEGAGGQAFNRDKGRERWGSGGNGAKIRRFWDDFPGWAPRG